MDNAIDSGNHHTNSNTKPMENSLTSKIFIKSAVDQMNLKLGMVITWINSIVQKKRFIAIASCLEETKFSASTMLRVYRVYRELLPCHCYANFKHTLIKYVSLCGKGQWIKVVNPFSGEIWSKFEIPVSIYIQICNSVHLESWKQKSAYVGPKWPTDF